MKNIYIVIIAVSLSSINVFSQQNVGIGTNTPNATAALEVTSPTNLLSLEELAELIS